MKKSDALLVELEEIASSGIMPRMLLHTCCAPCSTHVIELLSGVFKLTLYFYDPNIQPKEEYERRRNEIKSYADKLSIPFIEGAYEVEKWFGLTKGHKGDREGNERCFICYEMRLCESARFARENGFEYFGTVLSISPHKNSLKINDIGLSVGRQFGVKYLEADFKKRDGFKKSIILSKKHGLYRQDYCGCVYSRRKPLPAGFV